MSNFFRSVSSFIAGRKDAVSLAVVAQTSPPSTDLGNPASTVQPTLLRPIADEIRAIQASRHPQDERWPRAGDDLARSSNDSTHESASGLLPLMAYPAQHEGAAPRKSRQSRALNAMVRASTSAIVTQQPMLATQPRPARSNGQRASAVSLTETERIRLQVMQVQLRLASLSLYEGPIDGMLNSDTVTGVRHFQTLKGMRDTGALTAGTLGALGVPPIA